MICYDKYGKMAEDFKKYQQGAWENLRQLAEELTTKAIADGVCPNALRDTMTSAIECGSVLACSKAYVDDHNKASPAPNTLPIDYV